VVETIVGVPAAAAQCLYDHNAPTRRQQLGVLPAFVVLGVHKGGSTFLYDTMADHALIHRAGGPGAPRTCKELPVTHTHAPPPSRVLG
jgi:hypothetical protein